MGHRRPSCAATGAVTAVSVGDVRPPRGGPIAPHPARARRCSAALAAAALAVALTACGVLELGGGDHQAAVLAPATSFESERWTVRTELLATEIAGTSVIDLSFHASQLACEDGRALDPTELELGMRFRFEQHGEVEMGEPPRVVGVDLEVDCEGP